MSLLFYLRKDSSLHFITLRMIGDIVKETFERGCFSESRKTTPLKSINYLKPVIPMRSEESFQGLPDINEKILKKICSVGVKQ